MSPEQPITLISAASGLSGAFEFANGTGTESLFEDNQTYTLQLSNSGAAEMLTVTALPDYAVFINGAYTDGSTAIDLGTAYANEPAIATVMIENTGSGTLTLSDPITLPTGFTLAADYGTLVLAAGQATSFAIRLDSSVEGSFSGTLSITTDDPVQPTFDVTIGGTVVARVAGVDDQNFAADGDGWTTVDNSGAVGGQELTVPSGTGENTASWVFNDLDPTLEYQVYATWTAASGQATNASYTILDGSNTEGPADVGDGDAPSAPYVVGTLGTVSVDQTAAPSDETVGGIAWSSLGSFTATSGVMEIDLTDNANGTVIAGGIRIVAVHVTEPPVLQPTTDQTTTAGDDVSVQLGATDPDVSSGDLSYSLLNNTPSGMSIDASTGLISWDTTNVPAGTYKFTAQVSDGGSPPLTDVKNFSVTVDNSTTPSGSGEDTVIVYSTADANEGGSPGNIRLLRTGDQTGELIVQFEIDETVGNAAQYGSTLEYVGPDITATVDGILYGQATFAAGANTADITLDASADTDNAVNPTINFELLPDDFAIPGDAIPALGIVSTNYNVGTPSTATPVIRDSLQLKNANRTIGDELLVADHNVIIPASAILAKAPAGAKITYSIVGGNSEGMFTLAANGDLLLAKDASQATAAGGVYVLTIQGIGTLPDGTQTNVSQCKENVMIAPVIGMFGSTIAVRGTSDAIAITFDRFTRSDDLPLTVDFTVNWVNVTSSDLQGDDEFSYAALTSGQIVIPADWDTVTMVLYATDYVTGDPAIGTFRIELLPSTDANATYFPDGYNLLTGKYQNPVPNTHLPDANADTVLPFEDLYILDSVTAFAPYNPDRSLKDNVSSPNPGIDPNDVVQQGLGDCYFMAAEVALAKSDPQAIENLITPNSDGSFTVRIYNDPTKNWPGGKGPDGNEIAGWITFTTSGGDFLSNGWSMAGLSGDYNKSTGAVEVWPQLLEWAWVQLAGNGSYQAVYSGATSDALTALTGMRYSDTSLVQMSNQEIGALIQKAFATGEPVGLGTYNDSLGKNGAFSLAPLPGNVHYNHAYVINSINTDESDNVLSVSLINPWGGQSGDDYIVTVPIDDFSALFADLYYYLP